MNTPTKKPGARFWFRYYHRRARRFGYSNLSASAPWQKEYVDAVRRCKTSINHLALRGDFKNAFFRKNLMRYFPFARRDPARLP